VLVTRFFGYFYTTFPGFGYWVGAVIEPPSLWVPLADPETEKGNMASMVVLAYNGGSVSLAPSGVHVAEPLVREAKPL